MLIRDISKYAGIFGVTFNQACGTWSVFNEETMTILSEHMTELAAHAACRRYEAAALRRRWRSHLTDLSHQAI
jgi:hypothetical protein